MRNYKFFLARALIPLLLTINMMMQLTAKQQQVIVVTTSIQEAVNKASSNTIIKIPAGTYKESVNIPINLSNLTLLAEPGAILDAKGFDNGIVSTETLTLPEAYGPNIPCPKAGIKCLTISGLTIINAKENGILLAGARKFKLEKIVTKNNGEYGIFPICSSKGIITDCTASGHTDSGIYIGDSANLSVRNNVTFNNPIGIEVENCISCDIQYNNTYGNSIGILVNVNPNLPVKKSCLNLIANNNIHNNTATFEDPDFTTPTVEIPKFFSPATGLLFFGGGPFVVANNTIKDNTANVVLIDLPVRWWGPAGSSDPLQPRDPEIRSQRYVRNITFVNNTISGGSAGFPDIIFGTNNPCREKAICLDTSNQLQAGAAFFNAITPVNTTKPCLTFFRDVTGVDPATAVPFSPRNKPCCVPTWAKIKLHKKC